MTCPRCNGERYYHPGGLCRACDDAALAALGLETRIANYAMERMTQLTTDPVALDAFIAKAEPVGSGPDGRCGGCQKWRPIFTGGLCRSCDDELNAPQGEDW
jgi:hypothetical protein